MGRARFDADVRPILEQRCLSPACHGVLPDAEARGETIDWTFFFVRTNAAGTVVDPDAAYLRAKSRIDTVERPEFSTLLRKPIAVAAGGLPHWGGELFAGVDDPAYLRIRDWIASESGGGEGKRPEDLDPLVRRFASDVLPVLATRQCMNANCHGSQSPFMALDGPVPIGDDREFPTAVVEKDYRTARHFLNLDGDPRFSRLVRKALPLHAGGIAHRGGNRLFFPDGWDDPDVARLLSWGADERDAALPARPTLRGLVFVRGPAPSAPTPPFELRVWQPGTDVWIFDGALDVPGGQPRPLTDAAHPGAPADARDPAVSHDARRVAFAMRTSASGAHNIWEIGVDGAGLRQLTFDAGADVANREPVYGPDGRIYFASNRAGEAAEGVDLLDTEIWAVDPATLALERITHDPSPEARPFFLPTGAAYGTLGFTVLRTINGRYKGAVFRGPLDHNRAYHGDPEFHIQHGLTMPEDIAWAMRSTADGRFATVLLSRDAPHEIGPLALIERQFGPEVPGDEQAQASVPGYRDPITRFEGLWRDPAPLPDDSILVAHAGGDGPRTHIERIFITENPATARPALDRTIVPLALSDMADWEPEPIVARPPEDDPAHERAWDPAADTGVIDYHHAETLEMLYDHLPAVGEKPIRGDIRFVRLIESVPTRPDERAGLGLGVHGRARVLAEVPVPDGSFYLAVPRDTPFRVQFLDEKRRAIGAQQNRWISIAPGERFPGGLAPSLYRTHCAGCHGALSGQAGDAVGPVDAITQASTTLARFDEDNPRRPRQPTRVGAELIEVDWRRDVLPLLARSCAGCHRGADPPGGLSLDARPDGAFDSAYRALIEGGFVNERDASAERSRLVRRIDAGCPGDPPLSDDEKLAITRWIDLGAIYRGLP